MLIGLTQDEASLDALFSRAVLMAPCTIGGDVPETPAGQTEFDLITTFLDFQDSFGSIPTANWVNDYASICDTPYNDSITMWCEANAFVGADWPKTSLSNYLHYGQIGYT